MDEDLVRTFDWIGCESQVSNTGRLYNKCELLERSGKIEDALDCYDTVIKMDPRFIAAWNAKGALYGVMGKYDQAEKCFSEVIAIEPNNPVGWSNKGKTMAEQDKDLEALECYNRAIALDPSYKGAWLAKAQVLLNLKDPKYGSVEEALRMGAESEKPETPTDDQDSIEVQFNEMIQDIKDIKRMLEKIVEKLADSS
jgi:tetratricopeptide (TPR) repeat protein